MNSIELLDKLNRKHSLTVAEYQFLLENMKAQSIDYAKILAHSAKNSVYGNEIFIRGLIEISSFCKNDCLYCGIRRSNNHCERFRLTPQEILDCCKNGYTLGFRTFVLQGGEDSHFTDKILTETIKKIKENCPDCAVTLSLGERSRESYEALFKAGADRYLLRHESANSELYSKLHGGLLSLESRMTCLKNLKEIGYQAGCGMMIGAPYQTLLHLAQDLKFIESYSPDMCGIGPFIPHKHTIFKDEKAGSVTLTCFILSLLRIMKPNLLLPATTALNTLSKNGHKQGIESGANVIMPNLSPPEAKEKYNIYDGKAIYGIESAENLAKLKDEMKSIGCEIKVSRGDIKK